MASELFEPIEIEPLTTTLTALAIKRLLLIVMPDGQLTKSLVALFGTGDPVVGGVATLRLLQLLGVHTV